MRRNRSGETGRRRERLPRIEISIERNLNDCEI
jgi:hypothetical protein